MSREEWIAAAKAELIRITGPCANEVEENHLAEWAETIAESYYDETNGEDFTPQDAVEEDLSYL